MTALSDARLVESYLTTRSEEAFRALYREHAPYLFCVAVRLAGGDRSLGEELLQECWVRAAQRLQRFDRRSALRTWLAGILINCFRESRRRSARSRPLDDAGLDQTPARPRARAEVIDLERLVAGLPDGQREVLVLFDLEGYTHEEIAELLGIAPGTSKSRLFEARRHLRRRLSPSSGGGRGSDVTAAANGPESTHES